MKNPLKILMDFEICGIDLLGEKYLNRKVNFSSNKKEVDAYKEIRILV